MLGAVSLLLLMAVVNVALSLVDRAYFMEKGAVQFEGPASGLLGRTDLLRSVFLAGAKQAVAHPVEVRT